VKEVAIKNRIPIKGYYLKKYMTPKNSIKKFIDFRDKISGAAVPKPTAFGKMLAAYLVSSTLLIPALSSVVKNC
jgi:hypothetical protein